ncbi:MAG: glycoside hydrolase family 57 protein [bacterium]|nr:glycoside hydrolase family 57 protein [bacterium]MDZ4284208.1 glycoside hydrolase family 57 protein [Patescibacteria group bacterium]
MPSVCFYFQVHQPMRIRRFRVFDVGNDHGYFDEGSGARTDNRAVLEKVARKSYLPTNRLLLALLERHPEFRVSFSLSGVLLEQLERYEPDVLASFQALVKTGRVELLAETYYHSLSFLFSREEFERQVRLHERLIKRLFGVRPRVFRNTELIYHNDIGRVVSAMGYSGILAEGADHILGWRSPCFLYRPKGVSRTALLLKNYRLSDDIAFRFGERSWKEYPLTAGKFADWVESHNGGGNLINLFMDYETFGEHQWEDTGIFAFLEHLPRELLRRRDTDFVTPSEAIRRYRPVAELDVPHYVSWADIERDLSAWRGNALQEQALRELYSLERDALASRDPVLIEDWRRLQTSDHFYYMCTKWFADGDVHKYFNPYESPYDAFISYMNVLADLRLRLGGVSGRSRAGPIARIREWGTLIRSPLSFLKNVVSLSA